MSHGFAELQILRPAYQFSLHHTGSQKTGKNENKREVVLSLFFLMFVYSFLREREIGRGRDRERRRQNPRQALHHQHWAGLELMNRGTVTWAKTKNRMLNRLSHPGALRSCFLKSSHDVTGFLIICFSLLKVKYWKKVQVYRVSGWSEG